MVLGRFAKALEHHKAELGETTYWRYRGGQLPRLLTWLAERPELALALADDARELAQQRDQVNAEGRKGGDA